MFKHIKPLIGFNVPDLFRAACIFNYSINAC